MNLTINLKDMKILEKINGYKSYMAATFGLFVVVLYLFGFIDEPTMVALLGAAGFGGIVGLRHAISKGK